MYRTSTVTLPHTVALVSKLREVLVACFVGSPRRHGVAFRRSASVQSRWLFADTPRRSLRRRRRGGRRGSSSKQEHQYHQHQHQQYQPAHLYHDEYARVGADRAANPRSNRGVALPQLGRGDFYRPQVRAPYAVQDLPAAGKKPIDGARRATVAPRPERWGSLVVSVRGA